MERTWHATRGMLLVVLVLMSASFIYGRLHTERTQQFDREFIGYSEIQKSEYYQLVADYSEIPIPIRMVASQTGGEYQISFTVPVETTVFISASADSAQTAYVHPLLLRADSRKPYLLPLIRSSVEGRRVWNGVNLGRFTAGEHMLTLTQDGSALLPIPDSLELSVSRPSHQSPLATFLEHAPVIQLRDPGNVLDDIPLVSFGHIYQNDSGYMVTTNLIFSSENGGTLPIGLYEAFERTLDIEWVMRQVYRYDDDSLRVVSERFQKCSHGKERFDGNRLFDRQPVLAVVTPNNNFGDGQVNLGSWGIPCPSVNSSQEPIYYAPKVVFQEPGQWSQHLIGQTPELQEISMLELAREGCIDVSNIQDPSVVAFLSDVEWVNQQQSVVFPDRGCGDKLLQVQHW